MAASTPAKRVPRKAAPARKTAAVKAVPSRDLRVVLDLDALSKADAFPDLQMPEEPFTFLLAGVEYELGDPRDSDWKLAIQLAGNPFLLMKTVLVGADDPVDDPSEDEVRCCRERNGLPLQRPAEGTEEAASEDELWPDGVTPALIDRFTAAYLPGWKLNALFENWHEHYRIDLSSGKGILGALLGTRE